MELSDGWKVQAAAKTPEKGERISTEVFTGQNWYHASVPSTVLAVLVDNGVYKDIYFDKNLSKIPTGQFNSGWWYRNEFTISQGISFADARLVFEGINFRANVFLNGVRIATEAQVFGSFRVFDLDVTEGLKKGKNILAVEVFPPKKGDYTIGFVDWNPTPPDHNMGLFRPVKLVLSGPVSMEYPYVNSRVDSKTLALADLTVSAILTNRSDTDAKGTLAGSIGAVAFSQEYSLKPHERKDMTFNPEKFPQLAVKSPKLWWPAGMGKPELNTLTLTALDAAKGVSDSQSIVFGIRQVEDYINEKGYRGYMVNGRKFLIKGGGWADELLLRENEKNLDAQMRYTLHMNLNTIRLEGIWGSSQKLYDLADKYGILLMVGWSCQWEWEDYIGKPMPDTIHGMASSPEDMELLDKYFNDQVLWLRHHPSVCVFAVGSDKLPYPGMEKRYRKALATLDPGLALLTSCANWKSEISGWSAVKMKGPYEYVTPNYWYIDTARGGAFGFNTETGPGPQPPVLETLKKMIPPDQLWPINDRWNFHCGRNEFAKLDRYLTAFNARYSPSRDADDFCFRAQAANYEAMRPMFESFAVNRQLTTGIIQWMHNASWPKFYWQLYDYYLVPTGAFYGAKKACQPLTLAYDYGNNGIYLVNQTRDAQSGMLASVSVYDVNSKLVLSKTVEADAVADASAKVLDMPPPPGISPVYFLALSLSNRGGLVVSDNFYWLSTKQDKPELNRTSDDAWFYAPCTEWADFSSLNKLPSVKITEQHSFVASGDKGTLNVTLANPSGNIAFFVELRIGGDRTGATVVPVFWSDNDVSILPGQTKTFSASFATEDLKGERPVFKYRGWNVAAAKQEEGSSQGGKR